MKVAFYEGQDRPSAACVDIEWAELVETLSTAPAPRCSTPGTPSSLPPCGGKTCRAKDGNAWSPVDLVAPHRANDNVRAITAAVFDLDGLDAAAFQRVRASVAEYRRIIHSSHNHAPPGEGYYRLILALNRPALASEWPRVRRAIVEILQLPADPSTKDLSRFYFLPTVRESVPFYFESADGESVDVDDALAAAAVDLPAPAQTASVPMPPAGSIDLGALREHLRAVRNSKAHGDEHAKEQAAILGRALDGEPLAEVGGRHSARVRLAGMLAYQTPPGTSWESVLELIRPSLTATPLADDETLEAAVEKTRRLYENSLRAREQHDAQREAERAKLRELAERLKSKVSTKAIAQELGADWKDALMTTSSGVRGNEHNAQLILSCDPDLSGFIRWNTVTKKIEVTGGPFASVPAEALPDKIAAWMQHQHKFNGGAGLVASALLAIAREHAHDPLVEHLSELAWDGERRIDTFLEKYFGAIAAPEQLTYMRAVSRRWLISLVARALQPGCKCDTVLIVEGPQGVGKSRGLEALVTKPYFLDTALELGDRDTMLSIAGAWLVELGELASLNRSRDVERQKQFISSKVDKFRAPYGRTVEESPRRCIFVGTTNRDDYLADDTGNRRYWPVRVTRVDVDAIVRDRDLILAEAVAAYHAGESWWLQDSEVAAAAVETEARQKELPYIDSIWRWWSALPETPPAAGKSLPDALPPLGKRSPLSNEDVGVRALGMSLDRMDHSGIGKAMKALGFDRRQVRIGPRRRWRYFVTSEMLEAVPRLRVVSPSPAASPGAATSLVT